MLPFTVVAAAVQSAAPAAGKYTYQTTASGTNAGNTTIVVTQTPAGPQIQEQTSGAISGIEGSATATLSLASDLSPAAYTASYQGGGQSGTASVAFKGASATEKSPLGDVPFALSGGAKHFVVLDGPMLAGLFTLPSQMHAWNNASFVTIAPIYGRSVPMAPDTATPQTRPSGVPAADASLAFASPIAITIWYDTTTLVPDEIDVPSQSLQITRNR